MNRQWNNRHSLLFDERLRMVDISVEDSLESNREIHFAPQFTKLDTGDQAVLQQNEEVGEAVKILQSSRIHGEG